MHCINQSPILQLAGHIISFSRHYGRHPELGTTSVFKYSFNPSPPNPSTSASPRSTTKQGLEKEKEKEKKKMAQTIDLFTQYPLTLDPTSKAISLSQNQTTTYTPTQLDTLTTELQSLNTLHRALISLDPPNIPPPPLPINPKRSAQIAKLRDSANTAYRKSNYAEAVRLYTYAIEMALTRPGWEPVTLARDELAGLYSNRAQAYMAQQCWAEGLVDARASVEGKAGGNVKAWWRGGKCLAEMGRWEEAKAFLARGLKIEGAGSEGAKELVGLLGEVEEGIKRAAA